MRSRNKASPLAAAVLLGMVGLTACSTDESDAEHRQHQAEVAERGAEVMEFDLDATTHIFDKTTNGVIERIVADDPQDATQIRLVREHLTKEEVRFEGGDFSSPAAIHGDDMPGLEELSAGATKIDIEYTEIPTGAELTFTTTDPALVRALSAWADAQVFDHGEHANQG